MAQSAPSPLAEVPLVTLAADETCTVLAVHTATPEGRALARRMFTFVTPEERAALEARRAYARKMGDPEFFRSELAGLEAELVRQRAKAVAR